MGRDVLLAMGLLAGGAGFLALAAYVWRRRSVPAARSLLFTVLGCAVWTIAYALEMTTSSFGAATFWSTWKYLGIVMVPGSLLAFAVQYTERGRQLDRRTVILLSIEPALVMIMLAIPGARELIIWYDPAVATQYTSWPIPSAGPLFGVHLVYSYSVLIASLVLLCWRMLRLAQPYRRQTLLVVAASTLALGGNAYYNLAFPSMPIDPTPLLFTLLIGVLTWGLFRLGMIDLMPFARSVVVEQLADAVLVLDPYNRVLDANPTAIALFGALRQEVVGYPATDLLPMVAPLLEGHQPGAVEEAEIETAVQRIDQPTTATAHFEAKLSSVLDTSGREAGRVLLLREITRRLRTERQLREMLDTETKVASILQASLRPASLPSVPGIHMAARAQPAENHVGGDFYDVHQALGGEWAIVLGDVAGKGVQAAVITAMARYTVRALSAQGYSPRQVADQLNQALLTETGPESFCTMIYGRLSIQHGIEPAYDDVNPQPVSSLQVSIVLCGHPQPMIRRRDGSIELIGTPGTALGITTVLEVEAVTVDLYSGDVLLAYTDGVTEARRDRTEFGAERLAWTLATAASGLRGRVGPAAAGLVCEAVADKVMQTVADYAPRRDDVAVLVLAVE